MLGSPNLGSIVVSRCSLFHGEGAGKKFYPPVSMLKAQLLKHLLCIPSDSRPALLLKWNRKVAKVCSLKRKTPSSGLFTQFKHSLADMDARRSSLCC